MNDLVVTKQEDVISILNGVDSVQSYSQENVAILIVSYKYGTNMDTAYINMKKAIDGIRSQLPGSIEEPNIMELDMNAQPVIILAVSGKAQGNLHTFVDKKLVPEFQKLGAVGEVSLAGGQKQYTRIELKPGTDGAVSFEYGGGCQDRRSGRLYDSGRRDRCGETEIEGQRRE